MKKLASAFLASIMVLSMGISSFASDGIMSTETVVLENTPTLKREQTTTVYSVGIQTIEVLTTTNPDVLLRKNSGTATTNHFVTFLTTSDRVKIAELDMDATFTYDGNANTVSCTHKSYSVSQFNGWKASPTSISASAPSGSRKKIQVTAKISLSSPPSPIGSRPYAVSSWVACNSDGNVTKSPSTVTKT